MEELELKKAKGMITSVCARYATYEEINNKFKEFDKNKKFTPEELKAIVRELTEGKTKISLIDLERPGKPKTNTDDEITH